MSKLLSVQETQQPSAMQFPLHLPQFTHVLQLPSVYVKMRAIDRAGAERREMLMVCGWALSDLLIGRQVTHPPTPHFPYCTADTVELKPVVGVSFQGEVWG